MKNPFRKKEISTLLTVGQFLDNIEKNGLAHIRLRYFEYDDYGNNDKPVAACALGQGIWNTFHVTSIPLHFPSAINRTAPDLWMNIQNWNDRDQLSIQEIVDKARKQYHYFLDMPIKDGDQGYLIS